ncbi:MAG: hypothetical protein JWR46_2611 [Mycobacterium sp.]|jgi:hypothetical protein|nr:hypothetical protein [Mycobacterium sp.]
MPRSRRGEPKELKTPSRRGYRPKKIPERVREETDPRPGEGRSEQQNAPTELRDTEARPAPLPRRMPLSESSVTSSCGTATVRRRPPPDDGETSFGPTGAIVQNPYHVRYGR